jgi:hypothetical protein
MRHILKTAIFLFAVHFCVLVLTTGARTATYDVNLAPGGVLSSGGSVTLVTGVGTFGIEAGYLSPFYSFSPGDIVNFGRVVLDASEGGDQYGDLFIVYGFMTALYAPLTGGSVPDPQYSPSGCNVYSNPGCQSLIQNELSSYVPPTTQLIFTIPEGASGIQLVFSDPFEYTPAVPEPSTWVMLLIGFAGIGFTAYRRKRLMCGWPPICKSFFA